MNFIPKIGDFSLIHVKNCSRFIEDLMRVALMLCSPRADAVGGIKYFMRV